jgi:hypothetical protein
MIDAGYVQRMARYDRWQNENLDGVADAPTWYSGGAKREITKPKWLLVA